MLKQIPDTVHKLEPGSPYWVITRCQAFADKIFSVASQILNKNRGLDISLIAAGAIGIYWANFLVKGPLRNAPEARYLMTFFHLASLTMVVCFTTSFFRLLSIRLSRFSVVLVSIAVLVCQAYLDDLKNSLVTLSLEAGFFVAVIFLLFGLQLWIRRRQDKSAGMFPLVGGFAILLFAYWAFGYSSIEPSQFTRASSFFSPQFLLFPVVVFWAEATSILKPIPLFSKERILQLISPINLIGPLPLELRLLQRVSEEERFSVRLQGLFDLAAAFTAILIYAWLLRGPFDLVTRADSPWLRLPGIGFLFYLMLFLKSFWYFRFATATARFLELKISDGFNYALLAVNPMDRWTRWGIYYNQWLRDYVFFPVMVRTRYLFFSLACTFAASCFIHSYSRFIQIGFDELRPISIFRFRSVLVYYVLQCIAVYLGVKYRHLWPRGELRKAWWGVLVTIAMMSLIHVFVWLAL